MPIEMGLPERTYAQPVLWVHYEISTDVVKHDGVLDSVLRELTPYDS